MMNGQGYYPRGGPMNIRFGQRPGYSGPTAGMPYTYVVRDDFFVFEPQANLLLNFSKHYRVSAGVGYRVIGGAHEMNHQLEGLSGSVSLRSGGATSTDYADFTDSNPGPRAPALPATRREAGGRFSRERLGRLKLS